MDSQVAYNVTARYRRILSYAREEAIRLQSEYIDADHILLGLIREREGLGGFVIEMMTGDLAGLGAALDQALRRPEGHAHTTSGMLYTSRAKRVLEHSMAVARDLTHAYVNTEHILLGILRDGQSKGAELLVARGVTYDHARVGVLRLLGSDHRTMP